MGSMETPRAGPDSRSNVKFPVPAIVQIVVPEIMRTTEFPVSAIKTSPWASTATPEGANSWATAAGPPSPLYPADPAPATGETIMVFRLIFRTRLVAGSAKYRFPALSRVTSTGVTSAWLAGPLLPVDAQEPLPARVVMVRLGLTIRIAQLPLSEMYRLPAASTATAVG